MHVIQMGLREIARLGRVGVLSVAILAHSSGGADPLPERLSDGDFWALHTFLSEPGGYFRSDNLVGNEVTMQHPIPELLTRTPRGGVYLGVGPDQNFTYIAAMQPRMAFVVDIRPLNVVQHLYYKALFELSPDRAAFLARLLARPQPATIGAGTPIEQMIAAYQNVPADSVMYARTVEEIKAHLIEQHKFPLTEEHLAMLDYVSLAFYDGGPDLTYNFGAGRRGYGSGRYMPSFGSMMMETDADGVPRSYLATEANYAFVKSLQERNLLVPVIGDFAGPKALRAVGEYVRRHNATITAFYTSNVEQYLFQSETAWRSFFENVATLPTESHSTFVRALFNMGWQYSGRSPGPRSITVLCPLRTHVADFRSGQLQAYYDVARCRTGDSS